MRTLNPRHRFEALERKARVPDTEQERSLYVILHGSEALSEVCPHRPWTDSSLIEPSVEYPYLVFRTEAIRFILEAFLMSSNDNHAIGEALGMPTEEVETYRTIFFDTGVFRTQLERIVFLRDMPDEHPHKPFYAMALRQGLPALQWHFCQEKGEVQAEAVLRTIMTDSYFRSLEHRGNLTTSKLAREAAKYAKISMECARALIQKSETVDETTESLRLKFEEVRKNRTIEDLRAVGIERVVH